MRNSILIGIARAGLWIALVGWTCFGLWNGARGSFDLWQLNRLGKYVNAQVTGQEPRSNAEQRIFVHYAFNDGSRAVDNRFAVPEPDLKQFPIGAAIPVTYLPGNPHLVRIGVVSGARVAITAISSLTFVAAGLIAFGLGLVGLNGYAKGKVR